MQSHNYIIFSFCAVFVDGRQRLRCDFKEVELV